MRKIGTAILFLLPLVVGYSVLGQDRREEEKRFRRAVLAEFSKLEQDSEKAIQTSELHHARLQIYSFDITMYGKAPKKDEIEKLRLLLFENCLRVAKWRGGFEALENKIKDKYDGVLPLWVTQDRNWQKIDERFKGHVFKIPAKKCGEYAANRISALTELQPAKREKESSPVGGIEFLRYRNLIHSKIKEHWFWPGGRRDLEVTVRFGIQEDGEIVGLRIVRNSGDSSYDDSVIQAVRRSTPLPPPPETYQKDFMDVELTLRPKDLRE